MDQIIHSLDSLHTLLREPIGPFVTTNLRANNGTDFSILHRGGVVLIGITAFRLPTSD